MEFGVKLLLMVGGPKTFSVEVAGVVFVPVSIDANATELFFVPAVVPVTFTLNVQVPLAANDAPARLIEPAFAAAVIVPLPQLPVTFGVPATVKPLGSMSVKLTLVRPKVASLFVRLKVNEVVPPTATELAPKFFVKLGAVSTLSVAVLLFAPVLACVEVAPVAVFIFAPAVVPFTLTLTTQGVPTLMVPLEKLSDVAFAAGLKVGLPQPVVVAVGVVSTTKPDGNGSLKATLVSCCAVLGLVSVSVSVAVVWFVPLKAMFAGEKALTMPGA